MFFFTAISSIVVLFLIFSPTIFDRYILQIKQQVFGNQDKKVFLREYMPMFKTSLKMFKKNPILGLGPKSYRHFCNDEVYVSYYKDKPLIIDNTIVKVFFGWKEQRNFQIIENFVEVGDTVDFGDKLFSYNFKGDDKIREYFSNKEGKIIEMNYRRDEYEGALYINNDWFAKIKPLKSPERIETFLNSCNTHPHNIYFQLLAETGIIGFMFIFLLFLYILCIISKHLFNLVFLGKRNFSNLEICLLTYFFVILWPIATTGNFFNNWLNIISFYPLGFYLFEKKKSRQL